MADGDYERREARQRELARFTRLLKALHAQTNDVRVDAPPADSIVSCHEQGTEPKP